MSEQKPTDAFGSMAYEMKTRLRRFWRLSWWWKGPTLGGSALVALIIVATVAGGGGGGGEGDGNEAVLDPTSTPIATSEPTQPATEPSPTTEPTSATTPDDASGPDDSVTVPQLTIASITEDIPSYNRSEWNHWIDEDGDCQDTRQEVLIEESLIEVTFTDASECRVAEGQWIDPYTGTEVTNPSDLDIDHMVPLANAHVSGGWAWDADRKEDYANYLGYDGHLIAVTASANRSKGSRGPEEWKPPSGTYWCEYAVQWVEVKAEWDLTATAAEWDALLEMLDGCSGVDVSEEPVTSPSPTPTPTATPVPPSPPEPTPTPPPQSGLPDCVNTDCNCSDFATWAEAKTVFDAYPGDPFGLDGSDGDGIPCESLPGAP
jgi:hypothetical protein